jgi:hypothetical protein
MPPSEPPQTVNEDQRPELAGLGRHRGSSVRREARGHRGQDAEARRRLRDERDQWRRVVFRGEHGMLERGLERATVCIGHHTRAFEDHVVEAGTIECTRHVHVEAPR